VEEELQARDTATLINVFTVTPENQQRLLDLLVAATELVMNKLPGFVSANLHKSLDETKFANCAQRRSLEAFEAIIENSEANHAHVGCRKDRTAPVRGLFRRRGSAFLSTTLDRENS
jgi:hypothetical protein